MPASNYTVTGLELDLVFLPKVGTQDVPVKFYANGIDISNRYELSNTVSGSNPDQIQFNTYYNHNGYDLRYFFKNLYASLGPTIDIQPTSTTVVQGGTISFTTAGTSSGGTLYYRWQKQNNNNTDFTDISDGGTISGATTATLTITNATNSANQGNYRCKLTDDNGFVTTVIVTATVNYAPVLTGPDSASYNENDSPSFVVSFQAQPAPILFQWKKNGNIIDNTTDGGIYTNYNTDTLSISLIQRTLNGSVYTCDVTNSAGVATSSPATLTVYYQAQITNQPTSQTVESGATNIGFSLIADGRAAPTYQWQKLINGTWTNLVNETANSLSFATVTFANNGQYKCIVRNKKADNVSYWDDVISNIVSLNVYSAPQITTSPSSVSLNSGNVASLLVVATDGYPAGITYQWKVNGDPIVAGQGYNGYNTSNLTFTTNSTHDQNIYTCTVSNSYGSNTSDGATLTVYYQSKILTQPSNTIVPITRYCIVKTNGLGGYSKNIDLVYQTSSQLLNISVGMYVSGYGIPNGSRITFIDPAAWYFSIDKEPTAASAEVGLTFRFPEVRYCTTRTNGSGGYSLNIDFVDSGDSSLINGLSVGMSVVGSVIPENSVITYIDPGATYFSINNQPTAAVTNIPLYFSVAGGNVSTVYIGLTAAGRTSPTYQWQSSPDGGTWTSLSDGSSFTGVNTPTLNIFNYNTIGVLLFRCLLNNLNATGGAFPQTISNTVYLLVYQPPVITTNPQNFSVNESEEASFTVEVTPGIPTAINYQWQKSTDGVTFTDITNLTDGGIYGYTYSSNNLRFTPPASLNGVKYRCEVSSWYGAPILSTSATLSVYYQSDITLEPNSQTKNEGESVTFTINAEGNTVPSYQWQKQNTVFPFNWINLSNQVGKISIVTSATTSTLTISNLTPSDAGNYQCSLTNYQKNNTDTWTVDSATIELTIRYITPTGGTITQDHLLYIGNTANYTFSANAYPAINSYIYRKGITVVQNTSTYSPYSFTTDANSAGIYSLQVYNGYISKTITSNFYVQPSITVQPSNTAVNEGAGYSFSVTAVGSSLTYQWQVSTNSGASWSNIIDATNSSITFLLSSKSSNGYQYRCVVSNSLSISGYTSAVITSDPATLTIYYAPVITSQPEDAFLNPIDSCSFSVDAAAGNPNTNYKWYRNAGTGFVEITASTDKLNPSDPSVYSGFATSNLTFSTENRLKNYQYHCVVDNGNGLSETSDPATLYVNPNIISNPANYEANEGSTAFFSVNANGSSLTYQWYKNSILIQGATSASYETPIVNRNNEGDKYKCVVGTTVSGYTAESTEATLSVYYLPVINSSPQNQFANVGGTAIFTVEATAGNPGLTYQWETLPVNGSWQDVPSATSSSLSLFLIFISQKDTQYRCKVGNGRPNSYVTSSAATLYINPNFTTNLPSTKTVTVPSGASTTSATFSVAVNGSISSAFTYDWRKNGVSIEGANTSSSSFTETVVDENSSGTSYSVIVSSDISGTSSTTSNTCVLTVNLTPISISSDNFTDKTVSLGQSVSYTVTAVGSGTLTYVLYKYINNAPSEVARNNTGSFSYTPTIADDGIDFFCAVTSSKTSLTGQNTTFSTITVNYPPQISSQPSDATRNNGDGSSGVFAVSATGKPSSLTYQWQTSSDNVNFTDINSSTDGTNTYTNFTTNTLWFAPKPSLDQRYYRCKITNSAGTTNSSSAKINVYYQSISYGVNGQNAYVNDPVTFSISLAGRTTPTYSWQKKNNGAWNQLSTNSTLYFQNVSVNDMDYYRCVLNNNKADGSAWPQTISNEAFLNVLYLAINSLYVNNSVTNTLVNQSNPPFSYQQIEVERGKNVTFTIDVSSNPAATYSWRKWVNNNYSTQIATTASYTFTSSAADSTYYICQVTAGALNSTTDNTNKEFELVVLNPIVISSSGFSNSTVILGNSTTYNVSATGSGTLTYIFYKYVNNAAVEIARNNTGSFSYTPTINDNNVNFFCAVSSSKTILTTQNTDFSLLTVQYLILNSVSVIVNNGTPVITTISEQNQTVLVPNGAAVAFVINTTANPSALDYTWYTFETSLSVVPNSNSSTFLLTEHFDSTNLGYYFCNIQNSAIAIATNASPQNKQFQLRFA